MRQQIKTYLVIEVQCQKLLTSTEKTLRLKRVTAYLSVTAPATWNHNTMVPISPRQIRWFGGVNHQIFSICHQKSEAGGLVKPPKIFR